MKHTHIKYWFIANARGITQQQICDHADLNNGMMSNWLTGKSRPNAKNCIIFCKAISEMTNESFDKLIISLMYAIACDIGIEL